MPNTKRCGLGSYRPVVVSHPFDLEADEPADPQWTAQRFVDELGTEQLVQTDPLIDAAMEAGLPERRAKRLLRKAEVARLVFRWTYGANKPVEYATIPQDPIASKAG